MATKRPIVSPAGLAEHANGDALAVGVGVSLSTACVNAQTGTTYTIAAADDGMMVTLSNASAITVTLPSSLPVGFQCMLVQLGAGQVGMAAGAGATLRQRQNRYKIAGQYGVASIIVLANAGSAAIYYASGDLAV